MSENWNLPGAPRTEISELPAIKDRLTFIYLDRCTISREDSAIKAMDKNGYVLIPSHGLLTLLLGPGTSVTHRAIELISESGVSICWVGEGIARFYGFGRPLSSSSTLLMQQAKCASVPSMHMRTVRKMYTLRFPDENLDKLTLQQLRGKEGARVRKEYLEQSIKWKVPWKGRQYDHSNFSKSDTVNKYLSLGNSILYALTLAIVNALGLSPGLGFIHVGHDKSFIYDIADLYKSETTIPLSFELAAEKAAFESSRMRIALREKFRELKIAEKMVKDIKVVLEVEEDETEDQENVLFIWDGMRESKESGIQYYHHNYQDGEVK